MILDVNNEKDRMHKVYDANGVELKYVVWCDTETGEVRRFRVDMHGDVIGYPEPELVTEFVSAPIKAVKIGD